MAITVETISQIRDAAHWLAYTVEQMHDLAEWLYYHRFRDASELKGNDERAALDSFVSYCGWIGRDLHTLGDFIDLREVKSLLVAANPEPVAIEDMNSAPSYTDLAYSIGLQYYFGLRYGLEEVGHDSGPPRDPLASVLIRGNIETISRHVGSVSDGISYAWLETNITRECDRLVSLITQDEALAVTEPPIAAGTDSEPTSSEQLLGLIKGRTGQSLDGDYKILYDLIKTKRIKSRELLFSEYAQLTGKVKDDALRNKISEMTRWGIIRRHVQGGYAVD